MDSDALKNKLRLKAEAMLEKKSAMFTAPDKKEVYDLIEDLHVHQIELEIQNEELIAIQASLEASQFRYATLFESAPIGYVTLDRVGIVKSFNTTFLNMLPPNSIKQSGQAFADLLVKPDDETFRARFKAFFKAPEGKQIQARLSIGHSQASYVLLEAKKYPKKPGQKKETAEELLLTITDINHLERIKQEYRLAFLEAEAREQEIASLLKAAHAILEQTDFQTISRKIFDICSGVIGSTSGYIALLSEDGQENEVLFLEDGGRPCAVDPDLSMPVRGLGKEAYETQTVVFDNSVMDSDGNGFLPEGRVRPENVLFAPLIIDSRAVGVMGIADKPSDFTDNDASIVLGFVELAAIALKNNRLRAKRDKAEQEKQTLIDELKEALANVKQLSGLLPICSHCKKIRDDKGYWNQIESYIDAHSEAKFSHGICQECVKIHYPDLDLYDD